MERVGSPIRTGRGEAHPILVECVEDSHAPRLEGEADVDGSLSDVPARPIEQFGDDAGVALGDVPARPLKQFGRLEWQPPQSPQPGKGFRAPLQVEAGPPDWTGGV